MSSVLVFVHVLNIWWHNKLEESLVIKVGTWLSEIPLQTVVFVLTHFLKFLNLTPDKYLIPTLPHMTLKKKPKTNKNWTLLNN